MPRIDLGESFNFIQEMVRNETPVSQGMRELIAWCSARRPHRDWDRLGRIRWGRDVQHLARWLESLLRDQPPAAKITGLWFGLFNPIVKGSASADLRVAGNPYAADPDWACAPAWKAPAAGSAALAKMYKLAYDGDEALGNDAEYPLALGYAALAVRMLAATLDRTILIGSAQSRTFEVGFDSGDSMVVAKLTA
jgi:hypothetical protein